MALVILVHPLFAELVYAPEIPYEREYVYIEENSVRAIGNAPQINSLGVYASLMGQDDIIYLLELVGEKYPELYRIIKCESNFRNICNQKYGCQAGMGLAMIIPKTEKHCEKMLGRELDMLNPQDNLDCAVYLYVQEGNYHWGTPTSNWGTYWCWKKQVLANLK